MKKISPKKNAALFQRRSSGGSQDTDRPEKKQTIEQNIEQRAKLSKLRNPKVKFAIVFLIKTVETFSASILPSIISVLIIFINPNERSWAVMKIVSFFITASVNWILWMKYASMKSGPKEFYLMNGLTYLMYFAASVIGYYTLGYLVYSMTFANLRVFEILGMRTLHSIWLSNGIMVLILICCERFSNIQFKRFIEWVSKNGADDIEMENAAERLVPMQKDQVVETLSAEEFAEYLENDDREAAQAKLLAQELMPDSVWDETNCTKGRGGKVERIWVEDLDNDLTEDDFNAAELARREYEENNQYSGDALWNSSIYEGRTADGKPITEYDDEEELQEELKPHYEAEASDENDSLWDEGIYQGRNAQNGIGSDEEEAPAAADTAPDYDAEKLWESDFYQGRNKEVVPERVLDFSDDVTQRTETGADSYDADKLWDKVEQGRREVQEQAGSAPVSVPEDSNNEYDSDSLWGDIYQGRKE